MGMMALLTFFMAMFVLILTLLSANAGLLDGRFRS